MKYCTLLVFVDKFNVDDRSMQGTYYANQGRILVEIVEEVEKIYGRCSGLAYDRRGKLGLTTGQSQRRDVCM
jgi:hypothetical protein